MACRRVARGQRLTRFRPAFMDPHFILALAMAALIGVSLGVIGSGGSIVTLPVLVYVAGISPREAVAPALVIVGAVAATGAFLHHRQGNVHWKAVSYLGATGMVGAFFGSRLTHLVSPDVLMLIFAALMAAVSLKMLLKGSLTSAPERCYPQRCAGAGLVVGVLTGFLGVGGGFLIVPALVLLAGLTPKKAVGTSVAIITLNSAAGLAGQLQYTDPDWPLTMALLAPALIGMVLGMRFLKNISSQSLGQAFAWSVLAVSFWVAVSTFLS